MTCERGAEKLHNKGEKRQGCDERERELLLTQPEVPTQSQLHDRGGTVEVVEAFR